MAGKPGMRRDSKHRFSVGESPYAQTGNTSSNTTLMGNRILCIAGGWSPPTRSR